MRIKRQTDTLLELRPSTGIFTLIFSIGFLIGGIAMLLGMGQASHLICERVGGSRPRCRFERSLLGISLRDEPLEALQSAYVQTIEDSDGDTYKVILRTAEGDVPLTSYSSSGYNGKKRTADEINAFLSEPGQSALDIRTSGLLGVILSGVFTLIGLGSLIGGIQSFFTRWIFDRTSGTLIHHKETIFGIRNQQYGLGEIRRVEVTESDDTYRVELQLQDGTRVPLTTWYSSARKAHQNTANAIRGFLGL